MRRAGANLHAPHSPASEGPPRVRGPVAPASTVRIDRLVLEGVGLHLRDAPRLQEALASELSRLMSVTVAPLSRQGGMALAALPAPELIWPTAFGPERCGLALALALHRGLRGEPAR